MVDSHFERRTEVSNKQNPASSRRSAPAGIEEHLWRALPRYTLAVTVVPLLAALGARWLHGRPLTDWDGPLLLGDMLAIGTVIFLWTMMVTLACGCWVVRVMKGPRRVADSYPMPDPDQPGARPRVPSHRD